MSKMSKAVSQMNENNSLRRDEVVTNFMSGDSYKINPLDTLKMIAASSIFMEPSYYRDSKSSKSYLYRIDPLVAEHSVIPDEYSNLTTDEIFERAIDAALDYDFEGTLQLAVDLREVYNMRLNPQVIMVRASKNSHRNEFSRKNPGKFDMYNRRVMARADEPMTQTAYYLYKNNGKKNDIPSIIKRSWAKRLSILSPYQVAKYKNHEIGMINAVRICHAHSNVINELMRTGTVSVSDDSKTWENLRSEGKSWIDIFNTVDMGHMALLRNLRGVFTEVNDIDFCKKYLDKLINGVIHGHQFPFRYYSAYNIIKSNFDVHHRSMILKALESCMNESLKNMPHLKGTTMCLSDNSGSAWGSIPSEYGTVRIAEIDNLSSVIAASLSDNGYVGKFGDTIIEHAVTDSSILDQASKISESRDDDVGGGTEGGIWEFFINAIRKKIWYDNIFIFSDQQAGHGGLYGTSSQMLQYKNDYGCAHSYYGMDMINVFKLILDYRKSVNPKVNVFSIQTAGYDNAVIPEYAYRTCILTGWTGKEVLFASEMIRQWDELDNRK